MTAPGSTDTQNPPGVRLAVLDVRQRKWSYAVGAIVAFLTAVVRPDGPPQVPYGMQSWVVVMPVVVAAALAAGPSDAHLNESVQLINSGWSRWDIRVAAWLTPVIVLAVSASAGVLVARLLAPGGPFSVEASMRVGMMPNLLAAVSLPAFGALLTSGVRLPNRPFSVPARAEAAAAARASVGAALILLGVLIGTDTPSSGLDVDIGLFFAYLVVAVGLFGVAPLILRGAGELADRLRATRDDVAPRFDRWERRALAVPFACVAMATCFLCVESVVGTGLGDRERDRLVATDSSETTYETEEDPGEFVWDNSEPAEQRSDRVSSIRVREPSDAIELAILMSLGSIFALTFTMASRLPRKPESGRDGTKDREGQVRNPGRAPTTSVLTLGFAGALTGTTLGLVGSAWGLHNYNAGRSTSTSADLAPLPFSLPVVSLIAAIAIPVGSAIILAAATSASRRLGVAHRPHET
ncbi:MAG: hypothetical protein R2754_14820 [Microthrixaceae bacterium]